MKTIVFTFGKFNPPSRGHDRILDKMEEIAKEEDCKMKIFVSPRSKGKDCLLSFRERILLVRCMNFQNIYQQSNIKTPFDALEKLQHQRYTDIIMVVGSDREEEFKKSITPYLGKLFHFNTFEVVGIDRVENDESSTKIREYIRDNDWSEYQKSISKRIRNNKQVWVFRRARQILKLPMVR